MLLGSKDVALCTAGPCRQFGDRFLAAGDRQRLAIQQQYANATPIARDPIDILDAAARRSLASA